MRKIKLGMIGLGCRGYALLETVAAVGQAEITAVCDVYADRVRRGADRVKELFGTSPAEYADFRALLRDKNVEAVFIATPWNEHVRMATESLRAGKITAMEVCGAADIEECWELVRTYEQTKTPFMFMENCCYGKFEMLSEALVRAGKLGTVVHCHGAYGHDLRDEILGGRVNRHYRLENYRKRNGENYPTHELGPIAKLLEINHGNRMVSLVSVASKSAGLYEFSLTDKNPDASLRGAHFAQGDIVSTIITCANGETITLTLDTTLPRYYSREYTVRGTKGLCNQEANMVFLEGETDEHEFYDPNLTVKKYLDNAETYTDYIPQEWKDMTEAEKEAGHGGMDFLMFRDFLNAAATGRKMPVDVYDAAAWMCVTALSEQSVAQGGAPQSVPDFTRGKWIKKDWD